MESKEIKLEYIERRLRQNGCLYAIDSEFNIVKVPFKSFKNVGGDIRILLDISAGLPTEYYDLYKHGRVIRDNNELVVELNWVEAAKGFIPVDLSSRVVNIGKFYLAWSFSNALSKRKKHIQLDKDALMRRYDALVELQNKQLTEN